MICLLTRRGRAARKDGPEWGENLDLKKLSHKNDFGPFPPKNLQLTIIGIMEFHTEYTYKMNLFSDVLQGGKSYDPDFQTKYNQTK